MRPLRCNSVGTLSVGNAAQAYVERNAGIVGQRNIQVMELEMSRYSSCVAFVSQLKQSEVGDRGLDVAILNAPWAPAVRLDEAEAQRYERPIASDLCDLP